MCTQQYVLFSLSESHSEHICSRICHWQAKFGHTLGKDHRESGILDQAGMLPRGFQWKHPSKIKIQDVFHLLNHWRDRSEKGEEPLIWVTTSSLFHNIHRPSRQVQRNNRAPVQEESSDGERFILPRSSEMDEGEDSDGEEGGSHRSEASYASDEEWSGFQDMSDDDSRSVIISSQRDPYEQGDMSICEYKNASLYSTSIDTNSQYDSTDKHMRPSASPHSSMVT